MCCFDLDQAGGLQPVSPTNATKSGEIFLLDLALFLLLHFLVNLLHLSHIKNSGLCENKSQQQCMPVEKMYSTFHVRVNPNLICVCLLYVFKGIETLTAYVGTEPTASEEIFRDINTQEVIGMYRLFLIS